MQVFTDTRLNKCACICGEDVFSKCQSTVQLIFSEKSNVLGTSQLAVFMAPHVEQVEPNTSFPVLGKKLKELGRSKENEATLHCFFLCAPSNPFPWIKNPRD